MTRPVTLRLDDPDYDRLRAEASHLGVKPGTLARVLLHASLSRSTERRGEGDARGLDALDRLAALTADLPAVDAVRVAADVRVELDRRPRIKPA